MTVSPWTALLTVAGTILLGAALLLLRLNPHGRANRAFGLVLLFQGGWFLTFGLGFVLAEADAARFMWSLAPPFLVGIPFAVAHFVAVYPRPQRWLPQRLPAWVLFLVPAVPVVGFFAADPGLMMNLEAVTDATVASSLPSFGGPLVWVFWLYKLSFLIAGLVLSRRFLRESPGIRRVAILYVGIGMFATSSCQCATQIFLEHLWYTGFSLFGAPPWPSFRGDVLAARLWEALVLVNVLVFAAILFFLMHLSARSPDHAVRARVRPFVGLLLGAVVLATFLWTPWVALERRWSISWALEGFMQIVGVSLVFYAIARHQLFDINLRVKWALRQSTVAAVFVAVFLVATDGAQIVFGKQNPWIGVAAAVLLALALAPLQRFAERVAEKAMPGTKPIAEMNAPEREALFREQVELVWMEGTLTAKDRMVLKNLGERLGLTIYDAERIEADVLALSVQTK